MYYESNGHKRKESGGLEAKQEKAVIYYVKRVQNKVLVWLRLGQAGLLTRARGIQRVSLFEGHPQFFRAFLVLRTSWDCIGIYLDGALQARTGPHVSSVPVSPFWDALPSAVQWVGWPAVPSYCITHACAVIPGLCGQVLILGGWPGKLIMPIGQHSIFFLKDCVRLGCQNGTDMLI